MVDGRREEMWNHTSEILAAVYNAHRGPKVKAVTSYDFRPKKRRRQPDEYISFDMFAGLIKGMGAKDSQ